MFNWIARSSDVEELFHAAYYTKNMDWRHRQTKRAAETAALLCLAFTSGLSYLLIITLVKNDVGESAFGVTVILTLPVSTA